MNAHLPVRPHGRADARSLRPLSPDKRATAGSQAARPPLLQPPRPNRDRSRPPRGAHDRRRRRHQPPRPVPPVEHQRPLAQLRALSAAPPRHAVRGAGPLPRQRRSPSHARLRDHPRRPPRLPRVHERSPDPSPQFWIARISGSRLSVWSDLSVQRRLDLPATSRTAATTRGFYDRAGPCGRPRVDRAAPPLSGSVAREKSSGRAPRPRQASARGERDRVGLDSRPRRERH